MRVLTLSSLLLSATSALFLLSSTTSSSPALPNPLRFANAEASDLEGTNCPLVQNVLVPGGGYTVSGCVDIVSDVTFIMYAAAKKVVNTHVLEFTQNRIRADNAVGALMTVEGAGSLLEGEGADAAVVVTVADNNFEGNVGLRFTNYWPAGSIVSVSNNKFIDFGFRRESWPTFFVAFEVTAIGDDTRLAVHHNDFDFRSYQENDPCIVFNRIPIEGTQTRPDGIPVGIRSEISVTENNAILGCETSPCETAFLYLGALRPRDGTSILVSLNTVAGTAVGTEATDRDYDTMYGFFIGVQMDHFSFSTIDSDPSLSTPSLTISKNSLGVSGCGVYYHREFYFEANNMNGGLFVIEDNDFPGMPEYSQCAVEFAPPLPAEGDAEPTRPTMLIIKNNRFNTPVYQTQLITIDNFNPKTNNSGLIMDGNDFDFIPPGVDDGPDAIFVELAAVVLFGPDATFSGDAKLHFTNNFLGYRKFFPYTIPLQFTMGSIPIFCNNTRRITNETEGDDGQPEDFIEFFRDPRYDIHEDYTGFYTYRCGCSNSTRTFDDDETATTDAPTDPNSEELGDPHDWCRQQSYCGSFTTPVQNVMVNLCPDDAHTVDNIRYSQLLA